MNRITIPVEVKNISPKRITVTDEDGNEFILPYWELAWTEKERIHIFNSLFKGETLGVREESKLSYFHSGKYNKIVSYKRVEYDFWNTEENIDSKALIIKVDAVTPQSGYGTVYYEANINNLKKPIELRGYFYFTELDQYIDKIYIGETRWKKHSHIVVGDCLMGIVKNMDRSREEIKLGISDYLEKIKGDLRSVFPVEEEAGPLEEHAVADNSSLIGLQRPPVLATEINRIAVIDNDADFRCQLVSALRNHGYFVNDFDAVEDFRNHNDLQFLNFDVIFIDVNLVTDDDYQGIGLAKEIQEQNQYIKIVLFSAELSFNQAKVDKGQELVIHDYLTKPLFFEDVQDCLKRIAQHRYPSFPLKTLLEPSQPPLVNSAIPPEPIDEAEGKDKAKEILRQICKFHPGSTAVIFKMHLTSLACQVKNQEGPLIYEEKYQDMLKFSPLRDCIIDGETIFASEAQGAGVLQQRKHKWLLRFWGNYPSYQSCLGIRLEHQRYGSGYALFWFHPQKDFFNQASLLHAQMAARLLEASYNLWGLRGDIEKERKLSLAGKILQMTGHELATPLNTINFSLEGYLKDLKKATSTKRPLPKFPDHALSDLRKVRKIAHAYQYLLRGYKHSEISLKATIEESYKSLQEYYPNINIITSPWPPGKYIVMAYQTALGYAIFNLLLNAAQQMEFFHRPNGVIKISLESWEDDSQDWVQIQIRDTGPGIHARDFENIFREGVSSKRKGSGLGLAISRGLLSSFGGSLTIRYSILLVSSCFEIKLPLIRV